MSELPSDTFLVLEFFSEEFSALLTDIPVIVLKSQIYSLLSNRSSVERELDELRLSSRIFLFNIKTDKEDTAILPSHEHLQDIVSIAMSLPPDQGKILERFWDYVLKKSSSQLIGKDELSDKMGTRDDPDKESKVIDLLQSSGLIIEHIKSNGKRTSSYQFWSPRLGPLVTNVVPGRKEVLKLISSLSKKEISETKLMQTKLKKTKLHPRFLVRDLLGLGEIREVQTPGGKFFKLRPRPG